MRTRAPLLPIQELRAAGRSSRRPWLRIGTTLEIVLIPKMKMMSELGPYQKPSYADGIISSHVGLDCGLWRL